MALKCATNAQTSSVECAYHAHDISFTQRHKMPAMDKAWFKERKSELGINDADVGLAIGRERSVANKLLNGGIAFDSQHTAALARIFQTSPEQILFRFGILPTEPEGAATAEPAEKARPKAQRFDHDRSRDIGMDDPVMLRRVDVRYAMGPGTDVDGYRETEPFEFDRGLFRRLTLSTPENCSIVTGHGDSNTPTILDNDDLLIDMSQRVLNQRDRFWAVSIYGSGAVKRLRAVGPDRILVMSDNKAIAPDEEVNAEDVHIVGRVIWLGRRM